MDSLLKTASALQLAGRTRECRHLAPVLSCFSTAPSQLDLNVIDWLEICNSGDEQRPALVINSLNDGIACNRSPGRAKPSGQRWARARRLPPRPMRRWLRVRPGCRPDATGTGRAGFSVIDAADATVAASERKVPPVA